ncbi:MAG: PfkB family carbohydrate kinase [Bacteroidales bacterium]|jgi:sugar/nucleoside kinase (ribokinase family)|nr:PfkB family carbohydrate kinase [Bacteroidales bacterium]
MAKTLIVGSVAFDAIETPQHKTEKIIGGAGTYICLAASYFTNPSIVAVVGGDFPKEYIEKLQRRGVHTEGVQIKPNEKTFFWSGKYFDNMNQRETLVTELNVLGNFDPILPDSYKDAEFVMLGNLSPQVQRRVIEQLPQKPKLVVLDTMDFWIDCALEELLKTLRMIDVIVINEEEARHLSGEYGLPQAARKIQTMGPRYVIIKKGSHGALLFGEGKVFSAPALLLEEVIDPTGAGDTFAGGFTGYLAQRNATDFETMKSAVIVGSAMASFTVEAMGTQAIENLSQEQISARVQEFRDITSFAI